MALTQEQVDWWFSQNPNATPDQIAAAVQSAGGLEANAGLADMIANRYNIGANQVTDYYDQYAAPTGGLPSTVADTTPTGALPAPADNISTSYVKPSNAPTSGGVSNVGEGDDIETQIAQLPEEISHWARSADQRYMELIDDKTGAVLDRRAVGDFSDVDLVKLGLSMVPGAGQVLGAVSALDAARKGDLIGAVIGATGLSPDLANVNTALRVGQAIDSGNTLGALTALAGNTDVQNLVGANNLTIGGYTTKDAISAANLATAAQNGQWAQVIANAGNLVNSPDTVLAGKALAVLQAAESANPNALNLAISAFNSAVGGGSTTSTTKVSDDVPLTADEIADLTPEQLRVYQESGVAGLRDFNRAIKNMTSLTTSGLTGDSLGGNDTLATTGGLTGATRSLDGTGALSTATTVDDFENSEITRLRGLGYTNKQISDYLDNLNNLTTSLDVTDTSGLSDFGLAAFRQAKAAGATDIEALAAANLAISGKYPTGPEVIVTDRLVTEKESLPDITTGVVITSARETGRETARETPRETEREIVVTSGRETGQETERETEQETERETEIVVTSGRPTVRETERETEIIVTSGRETAKETERESERETEIIVTSGRETVRETPRETETEIIITSGRETYIPTEIIVTSGRETETETETEIIVTSERETETEIIVTSGRETETPTETFTETLTEIIVTSGRETQTETATETEIIVTATRTETETATEIIVTRPVVTKPVVTKPSTTFVAGTPAQGGAGKKTEFLKEQLLKTYMTKESFKDPLAQFNKARQELIKDEMMQEGIDPRLAAILAAKSVGEEPPAKKTYNYGEEPASIEDILNLKLEGEQNYAQGGYVQPLMAQGGMALPLLAAKGGLPAMHKGREDFRDGKHVAGEGDGQSDDIPAMLADGEFVFPADVVSALGNGSTKAGTDKLYEMMHSIRDRARSKGPKDLPPPALKSPLDYLKKR